MVDSDFRTRFRDGLKPSCDYHDHSAKIAVKPVQWVRLPVVNVVLAAALGRVRGVR